MWSRLATPCCLHTFATIRSGSPGSCLAHDQTINISLLAYVLLPVSPQVHEAATPFHLFICMLEAYSPGTEQTCAPWRDMFFMLKHF